MERVVTPGVVPVGSLLFPPGAPDVAPLLFPAPPDEVPALLLWDMMRVVSLLLAFSVVYFLDDGSVFVVLVG
jgi:hypothetical protein